MVISPSGTEPLTAPLAVVCPGPGQQADISLSSVPEAPAGSPAVQEDPEGPPGRPCRGRSPLFEGMGQGGIQKK